MSRCFPYPPPGYALSRASNEALIESIKLQKEKEKKAKELRKEEKRREKKEKKKEKKEKEKRKDKKEKAYQIESDAVKTQISEEVWGKTKGEVLQNAKVAEAEQLERSNLTEEHGLPVSLHAPSTSSDSTENSHKRKRHSFSSPADASRGHGKVIRIRFSSKKQSDSSVPAIEDTICSTSGRTKSLNDLSVPCSEERICSTSGRTHMESDNGFGLRDGRQNSSFTLSRTKNSDGHFLLKVKSDKEQVCSTSQTIEAVAPIRTEPPPFVPNTCVTPFVPDTRIPPMHKDELLFRKLIEDWVPPQLEEVCSDDSDLDWLFKGKKTQDQRPEKRQRSEGDGIAASCSSSSSLWPRAQYLQEVDIYALPYTVPY